MPHREDDFDAHDTWGVDEGPDPEDRAGHDDDDQRRCPMCQAWIYADAERCPECGDWITPESSTSAAWRWLALAVIVVLLTALILPRIF